MLCSSPWKVRPFLNGDGGEWTGRGVDRTQGEEMGEKEGGESEVSMKK